MKGVHAMAKNPHPIENELAAIVAEAEAAIDRSDLPVSLPDGAGHVRYSTRSEKGLCLLKSDAKAWFRDLTGDLPERIRETLCCQGYTKIDTEEERKELAEKLTTAICALIPLKFTPLILLLSGLIKKAVMAILNWLAKESGDWCENVKCALPSLPCLK
jgi:hypothetical protein